MIRTTSYKSTQFLWLVPKLAILILFGYFIYYTLTGNDQLHFDEFQRVLYESDLFSPFVLLELLIFSMLNWLLEITKWKLLASQIQATSWKESIKQSLASLTFSLITPNRIGEYGAKAVYFTKKDRKKILVVNFIGNFYQLIVTLILGCIGILFVQQSIFEYFKMSYVFIFFFAVFILIGLTLFLLSKRDTPWKEQIKQRLAFMTRKMNIQIATLSFLRYLIFSHQFYFLLWVFDVNISYGMALASIASMYLISSLIPMLSLFDFVVKGSVAVLLFSIFGASPVVILSITTLMWIFNFVLPAIIGSYYVLTFKPIES